MMRRECGDCQLCCKLLPVRSLGKGAGEKCAHQKFGTGCRVYSQLPLISPECRLWNCRWLTHDDTADLSRPDRSHYVIDIMPDFVTCNDTADPSKPSQQVEVIQVWIDPNYPDAHRDPALRAFLERRALEGKIALIRFNERDAFTLIAPQLMETRQWHEVRGTILHRTHTAAEIFEALQ